jgi:hypothetical protein
VNAPFAPPGSYSARLTVGGKSYTQPLTLHLDPRVKTSAADLATLSSLTREMYDGAKTARATAERARALASKLDGVDGADAAAFKQQLTSLMTPAATAGRGQGGGRGGGRGGGGGPQSAFDGVSASMMAAAMAMQNAEAAPTGREVAACAEARRQSAALMAKWTKLTTVDLPALNAKRKAAGQPAIDWK